MSGLQAARARRQVATLLGDVYTANLQATFGPPRKPRKLRREIRRKMRRGLAVMPDHVIRHAAASVREGLELAELAELVADNKSSWLVGPAAAPEVCNLPAELVDQAAGPRAATWPEAERAELTRRRAAAERQRLATIQAAEVGAEVDALNEMFERRHTRAPAST